MSLVKRGRRKKLTSIVWRDGVRYYRATGTSNRRLAERVEREFIEELNLRSQRLPQLNTQMSFQDLWVQFVAKAGAKPHHIDRAKPLLAYFGGMPIGSITRNTVGEYRLARHRRKQVSDATINRDVQCLRRFLSWATDEGLLPTNPLARVPMVRERRKRRAVLSVAEESRLLSAASPHLRPIIIAALDTGMRRGELLHQRRQDTDRTRGVLYVSRSKTPEGEAREIPVTQRVSEILWNGNETGNLVFTFQGDPIGSIKTAWHTALRRAGIGHCRFHDLRHTFNTRLLEAGVMQEVRKALMGHSSGESVHATYTHVELPLKRDAIRKLESWLAAQTEALAREQSLPVGLIQIPRKEEVEAPQNTNKRSEPDVQQHEARNPLRRAK